MGSELRRAIVQEVEWVNRFTDSYRAKLAEVITRMNQSLADSRSVTSHRSGQDSVRWCLEAVDLMLQSQAQFAKVLDRLTDMN